MPELPDISVYIERLDALVVRQPLEHMHILKPFVLRSVTPSPAECEGRVVTGTTRIGKRVVLFLDGGICIVMHLMIAGRLHWKRPGGKMPRGNTLVAFDFPTGRLTLTEAGSTRRASVLMLALLTPSASASSSSEHSSDCRSR